MNLKGIVKEILPPVLVKLLTRTSRYGWKGNYSTWQEAIRHCNGYDSPGILEKVKFSALKVKKGVAPYERDSVLFDRIAYSWPLLASLLWIAAKNRGRLNVLDFGGSLGSSYFQNRQFISGLNEIRWYVIEQPNFVEC